MQPRTLRPLSWPKGRLPVRYGKWQSDVVWAMWLGNPQPAACCEKWQSHAVGAMWL